MCPCWIQTHNWGFRLSCTGWWVFLFIIIFNLIALYFLPYNPFSLLLDWPLYQYFLHLFLPGPRWASWNLGIFICIRCAGIHRNLGVHISKVKSVNLDQWTQEQVQVRTESNWKCLIAQMCQSVMVQHVYEFLGIHNLWSPDNCNI